MKGLPKTKRGYAILIACLVFVFGLTFGWRWAVVSWKIREARANLREMKIQEAVSVLEYAETLQPQRAEVLFLLARAYRRAGELDRVSEYLKRAEDAGWPKEDIQAQRHLTYVQNGQFGPAERFLEKALRSGVDDDLAEEIYEAQAKGYLKTFRLGDAQLCLNYWIEWKPDRIKPRMWLADIYERVDNWNAAIEQYRKILELDNTRAETHFRLAKSLLHIQKIKPAKEHFEKCLEYQPDNVSAQIQLAICRRRLGLADDSGAELRKILNQSLPAPERLELLVELAQVEFRDLRRPQVAIDLLKQAEKIAPTHQPIHVTLSAAYHRLGKTKLAEKHQKLATESQARLDRLMKITRRLLQSPKDADLRYEVGKIYMEQGMKEAGANWMRTALIFNPNHTQAKEALAKYEAERKSGLSR